MQILKSRIMPCIRKRKGKTCDFELLAMPSADLDSGEIHVYGYFEHNHPFDSQSKPFLWIFLMDLKKIF
jgi:hypothetical protein